MKLIKSSQAGSLESNDVLVLVKPENDNTGIKLEIDSIVINQFGDRIKEIVEQKLAAMKIENAYIKIKDKGALDCTIEARIEAAIKRAQ